MFTPVYTRQFEKDLKRSQRLGKNLEKFKIIARSLTLSMLSIETID